MNKKLQLFLLQIICHVALVWAFFNFSLTQWLIVIGVYFLTGCLGVSVTLHRYYSHKSFEFRSDFIRKLFTFFSFWGVIGDPIAWVNNHRQHHRLTDKEGDPHSPSVIGWWRVQWFSMFYSYDKLRWVPNMIRDSYLVNLHKHYYIFHWSMMAVLIGISWELACVVYLVPAAILWNMGSFINTVNHSLGYRTHETRDNSTNNLILGYAVWGEGWHNNHHYSPANKTFGESWWEFDASANVIKLVGKYEDS
jgi:stearoyl-CoA desaturase (delta-9 desaturase)